MQVAEMQSLQNNGNEDADTPMCDIDDPGVDALKEICVTNATAKEGLTNWRTNWREFEHWNASYCAMLPDRSSPNSLPRSVWDHVQKRMSSMVREDVLCVHDIDTIRIQTGQWTDAERDAIIDTVVPPSYRNLPDTTTFAVVMGGTSPFVAFLRLCICTIRAFIVTDENTLPDDVPVDEWNKMVRDTCATVVKSLQPEFQLSFEAPEVRQLFEAC